MCLTGSLACGGNPPATPSPLQGVLRPNQAPIVGLPDIYRADSLLGKPVRVLGWCAWAPGLLAGRRIGAWFLASLGGLGGVLEGRRWGPLVEVLRLAAAPLLVTAL